MNELRSLMAIGPQTGICGGLNVIGKTDELETPLFYSLLN